jgi:hypothetical protein
MTTRTSTPQIGMALALAALLTVTTIGRSTEARAEMEKQTDQVALMGQFIDLMSGYLAVSKEWMAMIHDDDQFAYLVIEGIAEVYKENGKPMAAVSEFEALLPRFSHRPALQRAIRFKLRDLHKDHGRSEDALEQLHALIEEVAE